MPYDFARIVRGDSEPGVGIDSLSDGYLHTIFGGVVRTIVRAVNSSRGWNTVGTNGVLPGPAELDRDIGR